MRPMTRLKWRAVTGPDGVGSAKPWAARAMRRAAAREMVEAMASQVWREKP
jgi:hypothetical protein